MTTATTTFPTETFIKEIRNVADHPLNENAWYGMAKFYGQWLGDMPFHLRVQGYSIPHEEAYRQDLMEQVFSDHPFFDEAGRGYTATALRSVVAGETVRLLQAASGEQVIRNGTGAYDFTPKFTASMIILLVAAKRHLQQKCNLQDNEWQHPHQAIIANWLQRELDFWKDLATAASIF